MSLSMAMLAAPALAGSNPIEHVLDHKFKSLSSEVWGGFSMQLVTLLVGAVLAFLVLMAAANTIATGPSNSGNRRYVARGRLGNFVESVIVALRDSMFLPILGEKNTRRYLPFLLSLFFFILFMNLLGLVPLLDLQHLIGGWFLGDPKWAVVGGTATSNIAVNAALATAVFVVIQIHSVRELGVKGWLEHLCGGPDILRGPKAILLLVPILFLVEFLGLIIKPAALCIRLFANMVGGHTLLATLFMFGAMAHDPAATNKTGNWLMVGGISILSGGFAIAIYFLELFVAFLQAFIFAFLTAVFISLMSHEDHGDGHGHEDAHGHGAHHDHGHAHPQGAH
jgi:F-type H+-transporting ATPase subunit a